MFADLSRTAEDLLIERVAFEDSLLLAFLPEQMAFFVALWEESDGAWMMLDAAKIGLRPSRS